MAHFIFHIIRFIRDEEDRNSADNSIYFKLISLRLYLYQERFFITEKNKIAGENKTFDNRKLGPYYSNVNFAHGATSIPSKSSKRFCKQN